ncbi:MAG: FprA family A-type flavoprotein [Alphaproteobacteria bacterium]|nr:FprA family A-type flavoprotein [Alphaproteobacteria bacterium]MCB9794738.1 FprA family A-type flavoprotein [Alphaproteobacteria bacterium]
MDAITLFRSDDHLNLLLPEQDAGEGVQTNQHVIVHGKEAMLLDPGGTKIYTKVLKELTAATKGAKLEHLFLSHQDPDIVAALNGWLMVSDAQAWCSKLWRHFIPHFGSDRLVYQRVQPIPDEGMRLELGGAELWFLPAHFLHSVGNFHVYDTTSKVLYTGDLGASLGQESREVQDFDAHVPRMEGFHRRYMASGRALRAWVRMVRPLEISAIAPQHGAVMRGPELVGRFLDWCEGLECGIDLMEDVFKLPKG